MPLINYDPEAFELSDFSRQACETFSNEGYYLKRMGFLTQAPGALFELSHISEIDEAELHRLKNIFYSLGATSVLLEINNMNQNIYFTVHKNAQKRAQNHVRYKCIPPLPLIFVLLLCLYEYQKHL